MRSISELYCKSILALAEAWPYVFCLVIYKGGYTHMHNMVVCNPTAIISGEFFFELFEAEWAK